MEKSSSVLRLSFLETQTVIDSLFESVSVIHEKSEVFIRCHSYDKVVELNKQCVDIHHVLDILLAYQKSLI